MQISSSYPVILTEQVADSSRFYTDYFGFAPAFESDWYVSLKNDQTEHSFELAILDASHSTIPDGYRKTTQGLILNFEVDNVDAEYERLIVQSGLLCIWISATKLSDNATSSRPIRMGS